MKRLHKHADTLHMLSKSSPGLCKAIIKECNKDLITCLCEISHNILKGNVPITTTQKKSLHRYKDTLRQLSSRQNTTLSKKKTLLQKGEFLGTLLAPIIGLLGNLLNT